MRFLTKCLLLFLFSVVQKVDGDFIILNGTCISHFVFGFYKLYIILLYRVYVIN